MTKKQIGKVGEDIACIYLKRNKFTIIERNYLRKWGEIDIIAEKEGRLYFIEVKSVTYPLHVKHETSKGEYRPEDNINPFKLHKLAKVIQTYLYSYNIPEISWDFLAIIVRLDPENRNAKVYMIKDIVI